MRRHWGFPAVLAVGLALLVTACGGGGVDEKVRVEKTVQTFVKALNTEDAGLLSTTIAPLIILDSGSSITSYSKDVFIDTVEEGWTYWQAYNQRVEFATISVSTKLVGSDRAVCEWKGKIRLYQRSTGKLLNEEPDAEDFGLALYGGNWLIEKIVYRQPVYPEKVFPNLFPSSN